MSKAIAAFAVAIAVTAIPVASPATAAKKGDEIICKREKRLASRFESRICLTRAQWALLAEQHKRAYAETRDRPVIEIRK